MIPALRYASELQPGCDRFGPTDITLVLSPDHDLHITVFIGEAVETLTVPADVFAVPTEVVNGMPRQDRLAHAIRHFVHEMRDRHIRPGCAETVRVEIIKPDPGNGFRPAESAPAPSLELA